MRQRRWLELVKDYDCEILYHPGKANCVADALSRKSTATVMSIRLMPEMLQKDIQELDMEIISGQLSTLTLQPTIFDGIKGTQELDPHLLMLKERVLEGKEAGFSTTFSLEQLANLYVQEIVRLHGVPKSIVSDRDARFTSKFWRSVQRAMGTTLNFSTAFHPQTDGQSERTIQILEDMLRACVLDFKGTWNRYLPLIEFSYNNSYQATIGMAPYEALYGRKCRSPVHWYETGETEVTTPEFVEDTT
ncbi:hypothetical protein UlMin_034821 [Ulmus minor]